MTLSLFSKMVSKFTGLPVPELVSDPLQNHSFLARQGLGVVISQDFSRQKGYVPGVSLAEGVGPMMALPDTNFSSQFRVDYLEDGNRGFVQVNADELDAVRRDLNIQARTFGYITALPRVIKEKQK